MLKSPSDICFFLLLLFSPQALIFIFIFLSSSYSLVHWIFVLSCRPCPCSCVVVAALFHLHHLILLRTLRPRVSGVSTVLRCVLPLFLSSSSSSSGPASCGQRGSSKCVRAFVVYLLLSPLLASHYLLVVRGVVPCFLVHV